MYNLWIQEIIKVIKVSSKISAKIILMTKPIILNPNNQKTNKRQIIIGFSGKFLKFCLRIKTFLQMLEKKSFLQNLGQLY